MARNKNPAGRKGLGSSDQFTQPFAEHPTFIQFNASDAGTFPLDLMLVEDSTFEKMTA
jgi:hypothetical protein